VNQKRIYLSPPHLSGEEEELIRGVFESNWIAPLGPHVNGFEQEFARKIGAPHAVALSSGTAALHLALTLAGVGEGDDVLVSTLTFAASVFPIRYLGARPVFIDSEQKSWNLDPALLAETVEERVKDGRRPAAVMPVHLYGQSADMDPILEVCARYDIPVVEDAAEALGATYKGKFPGTFGQTGIFSFNGNKMITTSGGGMLVTGDEALARKAFKLATQAQDPAPHYQHSEIGFNYRLSNVLAAIGRAQLRVLDERVRARRRNFSFYRNALGSMPGIHFMPEVEWGLHSRWLTTLTIDPAAFGADREAVRRALEADNIEARPVWKPMHLQPVFQGFETVGGEVAERLFRHGLCLPSGSNLSLEDLERIVTAVREVAPVAA
jgi:pyridoxal phosphate-dependent aminotransferase EpsN